MMKKPVNRMKKTFGMRVEQIWTLNSQQSE